MKFVPDLPSVNLSETPDTLLPTLENRSLGVCPGLWWYQAKLCVKLELLDLQLRVTLLPTDTESTDGLWVRMISAEQPAIIVTVKQMTHEKNEKNIHKSDLFSPARESSREQIIRAFAVIFARIEREQTRAAVFSPDRWQSVLNRGVVHLFKAASVHRKCVTYVTPVILNFKLNLVQTAIKCFCFLIFSRNTKILY